jgi:hypothetical protein
MNLRIAACLLAGVFAARVAVADEEKPKKEKAAKGGDPAAMMEAWEKAGAPGEQHKVLKKMVGKWNVSVKSWMDPKAPPMESAGTAEAKPILGDRFIQMNFSSTMMGKPFTGIATTGYDNVKKKFVGTWIDSMSTSIMRSEGKLEADGKMVSEGISSDPMTGKDSKMRMVETWQGDDKLVEEFFEKKGGKEHKSMEITYTRAK